MVETYSSDDTVTIQVQRRRSLLCCQIRLATHLDPIRHFLPPLDVIENEYRKQSKMLGQKGYNYMSWDANMVVGLHIGVPWVMCKEDEASDPVINTCNGFYYDVFVPNSPYKQLIWTEASSDWFTKFGGPKYQRPVQDLAFAITEFTQRGGSFVNYYMYHGGTNFGWSIGGPFITTSYDYDAPLDEYGLPKQPKYIHLGAS